MAYDLALFEQLNDEYRDRPVVAKRALRALAERTQMLSPGTDQIHAKTREERERYAAESQLTPIRRHVTLADKVVLELGCAHGWLTASLVSQAGAARAIGVDVQRYPSWDANVEPRVSLIEADLSFGDVLAPESVDVVVSNAVFEHVSRPLQMLDVLYEVLRPGGQAWLRMNLYRARNASHRYRQVFFPWPHLLFEDEVCEAFYRKHHGRANRFSWVNRMTVAHYVQAASEVGFAIAHASPKVTPIDLPFYARFVDKLGRYPALDLECDFLTLVLEKRNDDGNAPPHLLSISYAARQRALESAIVRWQLDSEQQPA